MSTQSTMDASLWDKLGDGFTAVQEGLGQFLTRLFGSSNERYVRATGYVRPPRGQTKHSVIPGSLWGRLLTIAVSIRISSASARGPTICGRPLSSSAITISSSSGPTRRNDDNTRVVPVRFKMNTLSTEPVTAVEPSTESTERVSRLFVWCNSSTAV